MDSEGLEIPCPLQVRIKGVLLNQPNGTSISISGDVRGTVAACIDPLQNQFTFSEAMYNKWAVATQHNSSFPYSDQTYPPDKAPFIGSLTITLDNNYRTEIPNYELLSRERGSDPLGRYSIVSDRLMAAVGKGPTDFGPDIPILGGVFLSQNYLTVDYANNVFALAPAVIGPMDQNPLSAIRTVCSPDTASHQKNKRNLKWIAGPVVGGIVGIALVCVLVVLYKRRNARKPRVLDDAPRPLNQRVEMEH